MSNLNGVQLEGDQLRVASIKTDQGPLLASCFFLLVIGSSLNKTGHSPLFSRTSGRGSLDAPACGTGEPQLEVERGSTRQTQFLGK